MAKKLFVSLLGALFIAAIPFCIWGFTNVVPTKEMVFTVCPIMYIIGVIAFYYDQVKRERKKAEEEARQAEQDETNRLMQEYLKKKLAEDENKN